jgi:ferrochelatase
MKVGVLVFNLGGPESLRDVKPFLYRLFSDPEIIRIKWSPLRKAVAYAIATLRRRKSEGYYAQIGGGSPLRRLTEEQAEALQSELRRRGIDAETFVGMCTWRPFLSEAVERIAQSGIDRLVILPLFPQYSFTTTRAGFEVLKQLLGRSPRLKTTNTKWVSTWAEHPAYVEAFALAIERDLATFSDPGSVHLLFSAHSIPESYVKEGDPYLDQTKASVERIMDRLGRKNPYELSFQSKIGPVKWLEPATNKVLQDYGSRRLQDVLVVPISFVSEHIETLYELDILYKKIAAEAGITHFKRVPAPQHRPRVCQSSWRYRSGGFGVSDADAVVVGAGITGLTCAYRLQKLGVDTLILEGGDRVGGVIRTEKFRGISSKAALVPFCQRATPLLCCRSLVWTKNSKKPIRNRHATSSWTDGYVPYRLALSRLPVSPALSQSPSSDRSRKVTSLSHISFVDGSARRFTIASLHRLSPAFSREIQSG